MRHVWGFDPCTKALEQYSVSIEQIRQILLIVAERVGANFKVWLWPRKKLFVTRGWASAT